MKTSKVLPIAALVVFSMAAGVVMWSIRKPMEPGGPFAKKPLRIAAYSSFTSSWGPGPSIVAEFEKKCACSVVLEDFGDSGLLVEKMKLQGQDGGPDVVIGFDRYLAREAEVALKWRDLTTATSSIPFLTEARAGFNSPSFVPFDWAPLAFIYRKGEIEPPKSLLDLLDPRFAGKIALEDPRTSTLGLQFLTWVTSALPENDFADYFKKLKPSLHSISPSWSTAYGLFKKGEAKLVLSYLTSPIYHLVEEKDSKYAAAVFESGHAVQAEFAAVPAACASCERAEEFIA
ncbi:MAG: thiamine ABC transporter substrate-binding protein, partial [Bdellovibrionia bacterium]